MVIRGENNPPTPASSTKEAPQQARIGFQGDQESSSSVDCAPPCPWTSYGRVINILILRAAGIAKTRSTRAHDCLAAVRDLELVKDQRDVVADRLGAEEELLRDLGIGQA
jgi:hypothetical protein